MYEGNMMKTIQHAIYFLVLTIVILVILLLSWDNYNPLVNGEKRWATYTGEIIEFSIDCEQCCHPASYFKINTSDGLVSELIGDCDKSLESIVKVGRIYTIRIQPYAEQYAISPRWGQPSAYWGVCIDWIKDSSGYIVYGNEWW